jgi:hypothetical protein
MYAPELRQLSQSEALSNCTGRHRGLEQGRMILNIQREKNCQVHFLEEEEGRQVASVEE